MSAATVAARNALLSSLRSLWPERTREKIATLLAFSTAPAFALLEAAAVAASLRVARRVLAEAPSLRPGFLLERLLSGAFAATGLLLVLGTLTTAVSTLFLSDELPFRASLPIPHRRLLTSLAARTVALASAPALLLAIPAIAVGAFAAPRPAVAAASALLAFLSIVVLSGAAGTTFALVLVRLIPPRRALLIAAFLSAAGLAAALVGFRGARPERLLDPVEALLVLTELGETPPPSPRASPFAWAALAAARGFQGDPSGLLVASLLFAGALVFFFALAALLAPTHLTVWLSSREAEPGGIPRARGPAFARSLGGTLLRAEARSLLRDASTPAQLGSLAAVFVLDLLNVRLLPVSDASARDLVTGLQTALALFLVSALALRFAYPSVSLDGRSALVLRSLPLSPVPHLLARWAVRALPGAAVALVLVAASDAALRPPGALVTASLWIALLGGLAIPALHLGLGALFPRYGAPNAVAVALGPGGLVALTVSTFLSLLAAPVVSSELRTLLGALLPSAPGGPALLALWSGAALLLGALSLALAARALPRADLPSS